MITLLKQHKLLTLITFFLLLLPFFLFQNNYSIGGDDTRLYYLYPEQFLKNYVFNLSSNNTLAGASTGYNSVAYFAPFFIFISILKFIPFVNTQLLLYGLNLSLGFIFFYAFISYWLNNRSNDKFNYYINIVASITYIFSIYLIKSVYQNQLLTLYLVSLMPIVFLLFIKSIQEKKYMLALVSSLIFSIFSTTINNLPWISGFAVASLPIILYLIIRFPKQTVINGFLFLSSFLLLNCYWIFHLIYPVITKSSAANTLVQYSGEQFINDNLRIIKGVMSIYNPLNIIFYYNLKYFNINQMSLLPIINSSLFALIVTAGFRIKAETFTKHKISFLLFLTTFLFTWFLFSPNINETSKSLFVWMGTTIPFFTMFRNMFDKFSLPLAFYFALCIGSALHIILNQIKIPKLKASILITTVLIIVVNAVITFHTTQTPESKNSHLTGVFNDDFTQLTEFLNTQQDIGGVLWLPLNAPTYTNIEDKYKSGHFYSGLSPLRALTDRNDYTGRFSFIDQTNIFRGDTVFNAIKNKDFKTAISTISTRPISYVVVNHQNIPEGLQLFMYDGEKKPLLETQNSDFTSQLLGNKVKDFGSRYSLYEMNSSIKKSLIYLSDPTKTQLDFKKINNEQYTIDINNLTQNQINFLQPFDPNWKLFIENNNKQIELSNKSDVIYEYANSWNISAANIQNEIPAEFYQTNPDNSINIKLTAIFTPSKYNNYLYIISLVTTLFIVAVTSYSYAKKRLR